MAAGTESLKFTLPDGATLAYDIFGVDSQPGEGAARLPLVLITGRGCLKTDWERLIPSLSAKRKVLVYDHRGMGESTYSTPERSDKISVESLTRDAIALIGHVGWKDIDIVGFSMGGIILQQLLVFPHHGTPLPFRVHHAVMAATLSTPVGKGGGPLPKPSASQTPRQPLTIEQRKAIARPMIDACLSPKWLEQPENKARYEAIQEHVARGSRPARSIGKQSEALVEFDFRKDLAHVEPSTKVLVIHGKDDGLVPFSKAEELFPALPPHNARMVQVGPGRGQVPSNEFGHLWYEFFGVEVWSGVIEAFVDDE